MAKVGPALWFTVNAKGKEEKRGALVILRTGRVYVTSAAERGKARKKQEKKSKPTNQFSWTGNLLLL